MRPSDPPPQRRPVLRLAVLLLLVAAAAAEGSGLDELVRTTPKMEPAMASPVGASGASTGVPVVLVPGWSDRATELAVFQSWLLAAGWSEAEVLPVDFRDPVGSNLEHAQEVAEAVRILRERTGAAEVDVVAFSMGGLAVRHFLRFGGGVDAVRRVVFLGTPHRGTLAALFAWGEGGREMIPGSRFLDELNGDLVLDGVEMAAVRTQRDTRVLPGSSAVLPGAENVQVCCPGHSAMLRDDETFLLVHGFLTGGRGELVRRAEELGEGGR